MRKEVNGLQPANCCKKKSFTEPIYIFFILALMVFSPSCASVNHQSSPAKFVPHIYITDLEIEELKSNCLQVYPAGKWQFVHAIEFAMANGQGSSLIGITTIGDNSLNCNLMTIEGLTLFDAELTDKLKINRALPPFDNHDFAVALLADVQAVFIAPTMDKNKIVPGLFAGLPGCRVVSDNGMITDILPVADGCWHIQTLSQKTGESRNVTVSSCRLQGGGRVADQLELRVPGGNGYSLKMNLITAEFLGDKVEWYDKSRHRH